MDGYLVAEAGDGVVLVDQHAAHERVLYNRFLARLQNRSLVRQRRLDPQGSRRRVDARVRGADRAGEALAG